MIRTIIKLHRGMSISVTPSSHLLLYSGWMCSLFSVNPDTGETLRVAGTGKPGSTDGPAHLATFTYGVNVWESLAIVPSELCVYVTTGSGIRRIALNPKYFIVPHT